MISISCELCGSFNKDERAILEQNEHVLCHQCFGIFDDEELEDMLEWNNANKDKWFGNEFKKSNGYENGC
jgi:hypothetical protein|tara:strand:+ start:182 stop:391 length:210 start_codon:yes stop_codon:yes gene_type:complete